MNLYSFVLLYVFCSWYNTCASKLSWRRHEMETFSALLAICAGNSLASGEFPAQRPVTRSYNVFYDLCLNKRLRKQSFGWWFEKLSHPLYGIWSWVCRATYQLHHVNGLVQDCSNSITNALELLKFCAKPSMCFCNWCQWYSPTKYRFEVVALRWRHNGHDCVSNHQPHDCLLNHLFGRRSK